MAKSIFNTMESLIQKGESASIATIVNRKGSAPMSSDAKMLVHKDGTIEGTVGGGCLEAEVWQTAMDVLESKKSEKLRTTPKNSENSEQLRKASLAAHVCGYRVTCGAAASASRSRLPAPQAGRAYGIWNLLDRVE